MHGGFTKKRTRLWKAWKQSGLTLKQIGYLLGNETDASFTRYETGDRLPTLRTALMFEIILGTSLRNLFPEEYDELTREIKSRVEQRRGLNGKLRPLMSDGVCSIADLLNQHPFSRETRNRVHRHCVYLMNTLNTSSDSDEDGGDLV